MPISHPEDLWSAFDIFVLVLPDPYCIQVTTYTEGSGTPSDRKRKVEKNFVEKYPFDGHDPHVEVWAWLARKHFYTWAWNWERSEWGPREILEDPTVGRSAAETRDLVGPLAGTLPLTGRPAAEARHRRAPEALRRPGREPEGDTDRQGDHQ